ncbi:tetratricopeptide repeat protein [Rubrivivax sp. JA1055]|uniref:tetratricopeptide repeat-containing glycosyltransferase family protein n=1 Tax=Rubrivivax sp. JA1055 TaxID=2894194 RepID=UPI001E4F4B7F|nr:tetratricopeptide repeat protein [Rubrivivax sp. JA1055]MCC9598229.1 tetratricopeptide repeat protein [Rubrivivax sp. JA1055]
MSAAAESLFAQGTCALEAGDLAGAEAALREAIVRQPTLAEAHANLALVLERAGRADEAEAAYRDALALAPQAAPIWNLLGTLLLTRKRRLDAEVALTRAVSLDPASAAAWTHLGLLYAATGLERLAEGCHRRALELDAGHVDAALNLATLRLRQGCWDEGWALFERRRWSDTLAARLPLPRWAGEPLAGRSLLIGAEAGLGDMIQFVRYAAVAKAAGAGRVGVLAYAPLVRLLAGADGVDVVVPPTAEVAPGDWDLWAPAMSLPWHFGTRVDSVPAALPYLRPDPARVARWRAVLGDAGGRRRIGLVWRGNPRFETDACRSLPSLAELAPLAMLPGVQLVSLQKGAGEDEAAAPPFALLNPMPDVADLADTAALIENLDLVVSVDTAIAHLAGALGTPCALLLPDYNVDWRWLEGCADTPWYPGVMRLFRRPAAGRWADAVAELQAELEAALAI